MSDVGAEDGPIRVALTRASDALEVAGLADHAIEVWSIFEGRYNIGKARRLVWAAGRVVSDRLAVVDTEFAEQQLRAAREAVSEAHRELCEPGVTEKWGQP